MGKNSVSQQPPAPNPADTANAQSAANIDVARATGRMNRVDQTTPYGTQTFTELPGDRWSSNITLSPNQQALATQQESLGYQLGNIAAGQLDPLRTAMGTKIDTSRLPDPIALQGDITNRSREVGESLYNTGVARLQPQFDRSRDQMLSTLADRGIGAGSGDAWSNTLRDQGQIQNDALTQLSGQATAASGAEQNRLTALAQSLRQGGIQEQDWMRTQPIRDITALTGSAPGTTTPQFSQVPQVQVGQTDVTGPINQQYQSQMAAYNAQNARNSQLLGGLFSLGGSALGGWASGGFR